MLLYRNNLNPATLNFLHHNPHFTSCISIPVYQYCGSKLQSSEIYLFWYKEKVSSQMLLTFPLARFYVPSNEIFIFSLFLRICMQKSRVTSQVGRWVIVYCCKHRWAVGLNLKGGTSYVALYGYILYSAEVQILKTVLKAKRA